MLPGLGAPMVAARQVMMGSMQEWPINSKMRVRMAREWLAAAIISAGPVVAPWLGISPARYRGDWRWAEVTSR
jgi:hypothetical protein